MCQKPRVRFGRRKGEPNSFKIAHFANENNIRVFRNAERSASEKPRVSRCTSRWFTRHFLLSCTNSDWVFDSQYMFVFIVVDKINHGSKCCGLTRTGRPRH